VLRRIPHVPPLGRQHCQSANRESEARPTTARANLSTTADVYSHTSNEAEREAALALEQAIYGDLFSVVLKTENKNKNAPVN
jgi:hypothetical protein